MSDRPRCQAAVYKRDQLRLSRGHGFKLHYRRDQCSRAAKVGDLCRVHAKHPGCERVGYYAPVCREEPTP